MSTSIDFGMRAWTALRSSARTLGVVPMVFAAVLAAGQPVSAQVALADRPLLTPDIPGNLVLALSVEWPTAVGVAHQGAYDPTRASGYVGYFDPRKCYTYQFYTTETATNVRHFYPTGLAGANFNCQTPASGTGRWSGNFLNWATLQTIDSFRWAMTGGKRLVDTANADGTNGVTILEKARHSGQGGTAAYPTRNTTGGTTVSQATPFAWGTFRGRVTGLETGFRFSNSTDSGLGGPGTDYNPANAVVDGTEYNVSMRVRVCNPSAPGGVEANCRMYSATNYKPEGLIQQYSDRVRYSAFGYLNETGNQRDGAILRARQKFVAPLAPRPGTTPVVNPNREWDSVTGVMAINPDTDDDTAFGNDVANSGIMNYLNKFGRAGDYKGNDPVGELYYAATRYLKNQGNVPAWSNLNGGNAVTFADGFPVITNWDDPIRYSCQSNFILGIGDVNTHGDKNVPGNAGTGDEPTKPAEVLADPLNAVTLTNTVGTLEGLGGTLGQVAPYNGCCSNNAALMAGLAYDSHVRDIRTEANMPGRQTIKTLWVDVLENSTYKMNNQYYLATKYGGFRVPPGFDPDSTGANGPATVLANLDTWNRNGQTLTPGNALSTGTTVSERARWPTSGGSLTAAGDNRRPDSYFTAGDPQAMVDGLREAFSTIASDITAATTSFALSSPQVSTTTGVNISYGAQFSSADWTGRLSARFLNFSSTGVPTAAATELWSTDTTLATQLAGTGWDNGRRVVTFRPDTAAGAAFRAASLPTGQLSLLDTPYVAGDDSAAYLNYLRGSRANEGTSTGSYRARVGLLGDIAGSRVTAVANPNSRYSDASNPGYAAFVTAETGRQRMVYVGANDGMLHAFNGEAATADGGGSEVFAYVPSALFNGPTSPAVDGLVSRGNPLFEHKALVDATAEVFDIDLVRTATPRSPLPAGCSTTCWRSVLIGGLGKGGRSYYAIDVTAPQTVSGEAGWAGRVLWEFPNANVASHASAVNQMGFSFGKPLVTKTAKYGWVVILPSGYNSTNGGSYLFFLNPGTGRLLETVPVGSPALSTATQASSGLAHVQAYRRDFADNTAESVYAADLEGNVWRVDVRGTAAYSATQLARLNTPDGTQGQGVTTRLLVEIDPASGRRYVLVGTGRLLATTDIGSTAPETFYAITDGTRSLFDPSTTVVTRSNLVANTSTELTGTGVTPTTTQARGWYLDLGTGSNGVAWRLVLDPVTNAGRVAFATLLPNTVDPCIQGSSRTYSINIGSGRTALENSAAYVEGATPVIDIRYVCIGSQCSLTTGRQTGSTGGVADTSVGRAAESALTPVPLRRLNWRELQIVQ